MSKRPEPSEYAEYYGRYIDRVPDGEIVDILDAQIANIGSLAQITEESASVLHAPYTWTIKQVVGHMIDVERVLSYRALRWASGDTRAIIGLEQNEWVDNSDWASPALAELAEELAVCRRANVFMFRRLKPQVWDGHGEADGNEMSVRAAAYCLAGHIIHHSEIIASRVERPIA